MNSSFLVIGGSGYLGSNIINKLNDLGYKSVASLNRSYTQHTNKKISLYKLDITIDSGIEDIVSEYDVIIFCAGQVTKDIKEYQYVNEVGVSNVVKYVKKYNKYLIYISSALVYGNAKNVDETSTLLTSTAYGKSKILAENIISKNLTNYLILRVCNLYGSNQSKGIVHYILQSYKNNNHNIFFNNDGLLKRYYLHVEDCADMIIKLADVFAKGIYNMVEDDFLTIKQLVLLNSTILAYDFDVVYSSNQGYENTQNISSKKLKSSINYKLKNSIKQYIGLLK